MWPVLIMTTHVHTLFILWFQWTCSHFSAFSMRIALVFIAIISGALNFLRLMWNVSMLCASYLQYYKALWAHERWRRWWLYNFVFVFSEWNRTENGVNFTNWPPNLLNTKIPRYSKPYDKMCVLYLHFGYFSLTLIYVCCGSFPLIVLFFRFLCLPLISLHMNLALHIRHPMCAFIQFIYFFLCITVCHW